MSGIGPGDLEALAEEFLAACVESLNTIPTFAPELGGAPERSFVSPGLPVWDCCEQLAVFADAVTEASTNSGLAIGRRASFGRENLVTLIATLTRCVPGGDGGKPPLEADLQSAATQINADGWAIWNHIYNMIRSGDLFTLCDEVFWDGLRAVTPAGGCAGWTFQLRVALDGYEDP